MQRMPKTNLLVSLLAVTACHSSPRGGAPVDVAGHWTSECAPAPDGKTHVTLDFHNTADRWQLAYAVFGDAACTTRLVTADIAGSYTIGPASTTVPGAHEAVFRFDRKTLTPAVQPLADALNGMDCGGGFAVGSAHDVYEHGCAGFGQYPRAVCGADYDLVWRDGDQLRFGQRPADNNMCGADRRPTALAPLVLHRS